ncbi:MAG: SDR family oxidoreductase [Roseburia sp.]|nr:SDR family oxidoreductase [Anaeroplasma bactoclasticum]MCM1196420.1 SDR family oxidoreductase [Roseburia sp.]MCM1557056.1 SDR family oxidoreductase [Anaeroplasma bactoclasticum]
MKTVLITGATGGIGSELCKVFAQHKYNLILVGRNEMKLLALKEKLQNLYPIQIDFILADLNLCNIGRAIYEETIKKKFKVDILCNVAGFGVYGDFLERNLIDHRKLLSVNLNAVLELCHYFGNKMKKEGRGRMINIASISAFFPGPYMATYYASKAYILSFSIALAKELKPYGVGVSVVCPGVIPTEFYPKAEADLKHSYLLKRMPLENPKALAKIIYKKSMHNKLIIKNGIINRIYIFLSLFLPLQIKAFIVSWVQRKK